MRLRSGWSDVCSVIAPDLIPFLLSSFATMEGRADCWTLASMCIQSQHPQDAANGHCGAIRWIEGCIIRMSFDFELVGGDISTTSPGTVPGTSNVLPPPAYS